MLALCFWLTDCPVVMPSVSGSVRPRCFSRSSVSGVQFPPSSSSSSSSPEHDHLVINTEVDGSPGVLASIVAQELDIGSAACPWLIVAEPGQRINITLMDFASYDRSPSLVAAAAAAARLRRDLSPTGRTGQSRRRQPGSRYCREYAVVSEDTATKNLVVCSDHRPRTRLVYTSKSHRLKVTFSDLTPPSTDDIDAPPYFAIKYEGSFVQFADVML